MKRRTHKGWIVAGAVALVLGLAGVVGAGGCGGSESFTETTFADSLGRDTGVADTGSVLSGEAVDESAASAPEANAAGGIDQSAGGTLAALQAGSDQKIIADATLDIEIETGKFQTAFNQALLLADRYGGYIVSSNSTASGEENTMKSGTVVVRVPASSFSKAMSDAGKLGEVKNQNIQTQDVTEEYVDLGARITNQQAYVNTMLALLAKAKTVDEILQVQQTLTYAQQELEQLRGRMRFLEDRTSYSTLTMNVYETGSEVSSPGEWGFVQALKDALHNLVNAFSAIVRGLGWLIPLALILGIIAYIVYVIVRAATRRSRERAQNRYQSYPGQQWSGAAGPVAPGGEPRGATPGQPRGQAGGTATQARADADKKDKADKTS
jgi:hypothetical protein